MLHRAILIVGTDAALLVSLLNLNLPPFPSPSPSSSPSPPPPLLQ
ncbi:hypothetical protein [Tolypothrix sp. VBCCA 56010]